MSLDQEFGQISKVQTLKYIDEEGVHAIMVKDVMSSEQKQGYTGKPFIEFQVVTVEDNKHNRITFYRVNPEDDQEKANFKMKKLKEFIENLGVQMEVNGKPKPSTQILAECKGKTLNALYKRSEKIAYDKNNSKKPYIKEVVEYSFSKPITEKIAGNVSYLRGELNAKEKIRFEHELATWKKIYETPGTTTSTANANDVSFDKGLQNLAEAANANDEDDLE